MCGLYGFLHYGNNQIKDLSNLTNALAEESAVRGTDAAGIAFNDNGRLTVSKDGKSAYRLNFKHSDAVPALIGHTRHSTQGSEKKNCNNHPFYGKCRNTKFALAHNGVLLNDNELKREYKLPKTKIETDSYVAVQLLESRKNLNSQNIKFMAEAVNGSFSFSILDSNNTLWLVKGDSPLKILHFPKLKIYVYASTEEILWKALIETDFFKEIKSGNYENVEIDNGDIMSIQSDGKIVCHKFNYTDYSGFRCCHWWDYDMGSDTSYIDDLKAVASYQGYSPDDIDELVGYGLSLDEIEEYIYGMDWEAEI